MSIREGNRLPHSWRFPPCGRHRFVSCSWPPWFLLSGVKQSDQWAWKRKLGLQSPAPSLPFPLRGPPPLCSFPLGRRSIPDSAGRGNLSSGVQYSGANLPSEMSQFSYVNFISNKVKFSSPPTLLLQPLFPLVQNLNREENNIGPPSISAYIWNFLKIKLFFTSGYFPDYPITIIFITNFTS